MSTCQTIGYLEWLINTRKFGPNKGIIAIADHKSPEMHPAQSRLSIWDGLPRDALLGEWGLVSLTSKTLSAAHSVCKKGDVMRLRTNHTDLSKGRQ